MPIPESKFNDAEYLTAKGLEDLKKELEELKVRSLPEIAKQIEEAISLGDLTENVQYQEAKERQAIIVSRIAELEDILSRAVLISIQKRETLISGVQLGSLVCIKKEKSDMMEEYCLVGSEEADPLQKKISHESPLGAALLGKKKGEKVQVLTPNGKIMYTIIDVE